MASSCFFRMKDSDIRKYVNKIRTLPEDPEEVWCHLELHSQPANSTLHGIGGSTNVLNPQVDTSQGGCI